MAELTPKNQNKTKNGTKTKVNQGNNTDTRTNELSTINKYCKAWSNESGNKSSIYL
jgi:hypothetical protein